MIVTTAMDVLQNDLELGQSNAPGAVCLQDNVAFDQALGPDQDRVFSHVSSFRSVAASVSHVS